MVGTSFAAVLGGNDPTSATRHFEKVKDGRCWKGGAMDPHGSGLMKLLPKEHQGDDDDDDDERVMSILGTKASI